MENFKMPSFMHDQESGEDDPLPLPSDATPLEGLRAVYTNGKIPLSTRLKAIVEAAPYVHPKLAMAVTATVEGRDLAAMLDRAVARSEKVREGAKVLEAKVDDRDPLAGLSPSYHGPVNDRRYRR